MATLWRDTQFLTLVTSAQTNTLDDEVQPRQRDRRSHKTHALLRAIQSIPELEITFGGSSKRGEALRGHVINIRDTDEDVADLERTDAQAVAAAIERAADEADDADAAADDHPAQHPARTIQDVYDDLGWGYNRATANKLGAALENLHLEVLPTVVTRTLLPTPASLGSDGPDRAVVLLLMHVYNEGAHPTFADTQWLDLLIARLAAKAPEVATELPAMYMSRITPEYDQAIYLLTLAHAFGKLVHIEAPKLQLFTARTDRLVLLHYGQNQRLQKASSENDDDAALTDATAPLTPNNATGILERYTATLRTAQATTGLVEIPHALRLISEDAEDGGTTQAHEYPSRFRARGNRGGKNNNRFRAATDDGGGSRNDRPGSRREGNGSTRHQGDSGQQRTYGASSNARGTNGSNGRGNTGAGPRGDNGAGQRGTGGTRGGHRPSGGGHGRERGPTRPDTPKRGGGGGGGGTPPREGGYATRQRQQQSAPPAAYRARATTRSQSRGVTVLHADENDTDEEEIDYDKLVDVDADAIILNDGLTTSELLQTLHADALEEGVRTRYNNNSTNAIILAPPANTELAPVFNKSARGPASQQTADAMAASAKTRKTSRKAKKAPTRTSSPTAPTAAVHATRPATSVADYEPFSTADGQPLARISLNNISVQALVDSGSNVNVMYRNPWGPRIDSLLAEGATQKFHTATHSSSGPSVRITASINGCTTTADFLVLDAPRPLPYQAILGTALMRTFGLGIVPSGDQTIFYLDGTAYPVSAALGSKSKTSRINMLYSEEFCLQKYDEILRWNEVASITSDDDDDDDDDTFGSACLNALVEDRFTLDVGDAPGVDVTVVNEFVHAHAHFFHHDDSELLAPRHVLKLVFDGDPKLSSTPHRVGTMQREAIVEWITGALARNEIELAPELTRGSRIFVVVQGTKIRIVHDYREVNKVLVRAPAVLPDMGTMLRHTADAVFMSSLDIKNAFYSVGLHPNSRDACAFIAPDGLVYRPRTIGFGLSISPQTFQAFVDAALLPIVEYYSRNGASVYAYLDDILVLQHDPSGSVPDGARRQ